MPIESPDSREHKVIRVVVTVAAIALFESHLHMQIYSCYDGVRCSLKHFISFAFCFNLLSDYDIEPLMPVLTTLMKSKSSSKSSVAFR